MRQRLLFLDSRRHIGGDGIVLTTMFEHLSSDRYEKIVAVPANGELAERLKQLPGRCLELSYGLADSRLAKVFGLLATIWALTVLVWREDIRLVHSNNTTRSLFIAVCLYFTTLGRIQLIYHGHCSPQYSLPHRLALKLCSQLWAVSEYVAQQYRDIGVPAERIQVIYNGRELQQASHAEIEAWRAKLDIPESAKVAVVCGRLAPNKGQHLAIEAFAEWTQSQQDHESEALGSTDARLLIVGDDSIVDNNENYCQQLKDLTEALNIHESVHFCGFQSQVAPLLKLADVALVPSLNEPFGLTAIEALSQGTSLLASDSGGLPEILEVAQIQPIERTGTGFASALEQLFSVGHRSCNAETQNRVQQVFSVPAFIDRVESQLNKLVSVS